MKLIVYIFSLFSLCSFGQKNDKMQHRYTNNLIHETSPYLLQHAHNPVDWEAWSAKTLKKAKQENKLIIISVGYAACHWCHVMEHESFEDEEVASIMNANYINIKIDREERPDIDQIYMNAVQIMTGQGGWPMNVIALPDGRPIWGGTYFKKVQWTSALNQIAKLFKDNPDKLEDYATKLTQGIVAMDAIKTNPESPVFENSFIDTIVKNWSKDFDTKKGGMQGAPKFMMPNNHHFLMRYAYHNNDDKILSYVNKTLIQMAYGGVFDQIGGGFSRYSVDTKWHIPHFEKMLYDNGQLVSLYADAYSLTKNQLFKNVVTETLGFIERELTNSNGAFYSSLDADSISKTGELEEGAFYVWTKEELKILLKEDYELFSNYYNINSYGYWEHKNYVLIRDENDNNFITKNKISLDVLKNKKEHWKRILLVEREKRNRPRLDDKVLTSWNAIMLKGYIDAYRSLRNNDDLEVAKKNANFILNNLIKEDGGLYHNFKNGKASINGFLEDYANTIEAFISLYEVTLNEKWLKNAKALTDYSLDAFFSEKNQLFYFTSIKDEPLISRTFEYRDNVIPASNSILAKCLFKLSHYYDNKYYLKISSNMLNTIKPEITTYSSAYSNWLDLMLNFSTSFYEVAIVGEDAIDKIKELNAHYIPNKIIAGSLIDNNLPLLIKRYTENETYIYVCINKTCKKPTKNIIEALNNIKK